MQLFRAVPLQTYDPERVHTRHPGVRLPGNVPYFVDNLWELTRPSDKPSRRHAVYASPTIQLALDGAAGVDQPQDGYVVGRVDCRIPPKTFQLSVADARYHPDLKRLQKAVHDKISGRNPLAFAEKLALAPLFLPGVTRGEMTGAMETSVLLRELVNELASMVTLWSDTPNAAIGELFFEIEEGNTYMLHRV